MLLYRVFPHLTRASPGEPGDARHLHPDQGTGRWDNPDLYLAMYVASEPSGAIGETFHTITKWSAAMLPFPALPGSERRLATFILDEEAWPLLDLDDPKVLVDRSVRPSEVVVRNRPRTQAIARAVYEERRWSGMTWRSNVRPQWTVHVLWERAGLELTGVSRLPGHAALYDANARLFRAPLPFDLR